MNINNNNEEVNDDDAFEEADEVVDKSWRSNMTVRNIIKFTAVGVLALVGCTGVRAAYNLPEAREVSEVTKEVLVLKAEVINEVIPAAKGAKANPQALKIMLDRNRMELHSIMAKLEKLQKERFRLRKDIISDLVEIVVLGRSYTYNKGLEGAHKCGKSFWCSLFVEVEKYESLRGTLKDLNQDLNKLRMILLHLEDIDQVELTSNVDVNTYLSLGLGGSDEFIGDKNDGTMEKEIKREIKDRKKNR